MPPLIPPTGVSIGVLFEGAVGSAGAEMLGATGAKGGATGAFAWREITDPGLTANTIM
jgi:hypothetical protein